MAYTDAIYEEVIDAFDNGYSRATHLSKMMCQNHPTAQVEGLPPQPLRGKDLNGHYPS